MSVELVLKIFIDAMVTGCSSERSSVTFAGQKSRPYSKTGIDFDDNKCTITSGEAQRPDDRKWRQMSGKN